MPHLDVPVAAEVGVGCAAVLVRLQEGREDLVPVLALETHLLESDVELPAHPLRVHALTLATIVPLAILAPVPVGHVHAHDVVALLLKEERGDRRVHAARHTDGHRRALPAPLSQQGRRGATHGKLEADLREGGTGSKPSLYTRVQVCACQNV